MKYVFALFLTMLLLAGLQRCAKVNPAGQTPPNAVDSFVKDANGVVYVDVDDTLRKVDIKTGLTQWSSWLLYLFSSYNSPLDFDSGNIYKGGLYGVATYNYQTGARIWSCDLPSEPDAALPSGYRAVAITDSLAFYTGPTGRFFGGARLYCINKRTGTAIWNNLIDSIQTTLSDFNGIPIVSGNEVITLTRNANGDTQIAAYEVATGAKRWATVVNDQLSDRLKVSGGNIYNTDGQYAYCFGAADGRLEWQTDMQFSGTNYSSFSFIDQNELIVARNYGLTANVVKVFSAVTGTLINSFTGNVTGALDFRGYAYRKNVLYTVNYVTDSIEIHAFDINANIEKWKFRYYQSSTQGAIATDQIVIFPSGIGGPSGISIQAQMTILDLNGKFLKSVPFQGFNTDKFMYVDSTGIVYKQQDF